LGFEPRLMVAVSVVVCYDCFMKTPQEGEGKMTFRDVMFRNVPNYPGLSYVISGDPEQDGKLFWELWEDNDNPHDKMYSTRQVADWSDNLYYTEEEAFEDMLAHIESEPRYSGR